MGGSWQTSTLSFLLIGTVLLYGIGTIVLMFRGAVTDLAPFQWLLNILLPLYGVKRGVEAMKNGNGKPTEEPPKP